jgi:hypothetical protein
MVELGLGTVRRNWNLVNPSELFLLCRSTIAAAHGSSFIKSTAGRAPLRALDVLEGSRLLAPVKR